MATLLLAGCAAHGAPDAGASDAGTRDSGTPADSGIPDADAGGSTADGGPTWYLDEGARAERCDAVLAERRERCGPLFCFDSECPQAGECGDVLFATDQERFGCASGERVEDDCGRGCLTRRGAPALCGVLDRMDCGPDRVCTYGCSGIAGECEPRPALCDPANAELACTCSETPVWDACEARQAGTVVFEGCNLPRVPCAIPAPLDPGTCATPELLRWQFDGEVCTSTLVCREQGWPDEESCIRYRRDFCPNGPRSSIRPCRNNDVCDPLEMCLFPPDDSCGRAGAMGRCQLVPQGCFRVGKPDVCGCDGRTYESTCDAIVAHVPVAHLGVCETPIP